MGISNRKVELTLREKSARLKKLSVQPHILPGKVSLPNKTQSSYKGLVEDMETSTVYTRILASFCD